MQNALFYDVGVINLEFQEIPVAREEPPNLRARRGRNAFLREYARSVNRPPKRAWVELSRTDKGGPWAKAFASATKPGRIGRRFRCNEVLRACTISLASRPAAHCPASAY